MKERTGLGNMKCPKCGSENTKKVSVIDDNWKMGVQRCNDCYYQGYWGEFCDPPIDFTLPYPVMKNEIIELQIASKKLLYMIECYIQVRKQIHEKYHGEEWWGTSDDYMWTVAPSNLLNLQHLLFEDIFRVDMFGEEISVEFCWYDEANRSSDETLRFPLSHLYIAEDDLEHLLVTEMKEKHKLAEEAAALKHKEREEVQERLERKTLARLKEKYEK